MLIEHEQRKLVTSRKEKLAVFVASDKTQFQMKIRILEILYFLLFLTCISLRLMMLGIFSCAYLPSLYLLW